jgi:hypothetical protein
MLSLFWPAEIHTTCPHEKTVKGHTQSPAGRGRSAAPRWRTKRKRKEGAVERKWFFLQAARSGRRPRPGWAAPTRATYCYEQGSLSRLRSAAPVRSTGSQKAQGCPRTARARGQQNGLGGLAEIRSEHGGRLRGAGRPRGLRLRGLHGVVCRQGLARCQGGIVALYRGIAPVENVFHAQAHHRIQI